MHRHQGVCWQRPTLSADRSRNKCPESLEEPSTGTYSAGPIALSAQVGTCGLWRPHVTIASPHCDGASGVYGHHRRRRRPHRRMAVEQP